MSSTTHAPTTTRLTDLRQAGYVAAIVVNLFLLVVAHNLLSWRILSFLTEDFKRLLPLIDLSLVATILFNLAYIAYELGWVRSIGQILLNAVSFLVAVRIYQVFPFDFSGSQFDWAQVARVVIVLTMVGVVIGAVAELIKLVRLGIEALGRQTP